MDFIVAKNIHKAYGDVVALEDFSFSIHENELFGLIGPDGAGKTTLIRILTTLMLPDKGSVKVMDFDVVKDYKSIRNITGYMPGKFSLYQDLSVEENLNFYAHIFHTTVQENYHLIKDIYQQIEPFKKRLAGKLSGGMKQKLALSCALIHKPKLLVLDEPTFGVDAVSRMEFWQMLKNLKKSGITILVSTPYMDEAGMCDRVALIQKGKMLDMDSPEGISKKFRDPLYAIKSKQKRKLIGDLRKHECAKHVFPFGETVHFTATQEISPQQMQSYLQNKGHTDIYIQPIAAGIEDCFMHLMTNV